MTIEYQPNELRPQFKFTVYLPADTTELLPVVILGNDLIQATSRFLQWVDEHMIGE